MGEVCLLVNETAYNNKYFCIFWKNVSKPRIKNDVILKYSSQMA